MNGCLLYIPCLPYLLPNPPSSPESAPGHEELSFRTVVLSDLGVQGACFGHPSCVCYDLSHIQFFIPLITTSSYLISWETGIKSYGLNHTNVAKWVLQVPEFHSVYCFSCAWVMETIGMAALKWMWTRNCDYVELRPLHSRHKLLTSLQTY